MKKVFIFLFVAIFLVLGGILVMERSSLDFEEVLIFFVLLVVATFLSIFLLYVLRKLFGFVLSLFAQAKFFIGVLLLSVGMYAILVLSSIIFLIAAWFAVSLGSIFLFYAFFYADKTLWDAIASTMLALYNSVIKVSGVKLERAAWTVSDEVWQKGFKKELLGRALVCSEVAIPIVQAIIAENDSEDMRRCIRAVSLLDKSDLSQLLTILESKKSP